MGLGLRLSFNPIDALHPADRRITIPRSQRSPHQCLVTPQDQHIDIMMIPDCPASRIIQNNPSPQPKPRPGVVGWAESLRSPSLSNHHMSEAKIFEISPISPTADGINRPHQSPPTARRSHSPTPPPIKKSFLLLFYQKRSLSSPYLPLPPVTSPSPAHAHPCRPPPLPLQEQTTNINRP